MGALRNIAHLVELELAVDVQHCFGMQPTDKHAAAIDVHHIDVKVIG